MASKRSSIFDGARSTSPRRCEKCLWSGLQGVWHHLQQPVQKAAGPWRGALCFYHNVYQTHSVVHAKGGYPALVQQKCFQPVSGNCARFRFYQMKLLKSVMNSAPNGDAASETHHGLLIHKYKAIFSAWIFATKVWRRKKARFLHDESAAKWT